MLTLLHEITVPASNPTASAYLRRGTDAFAAVLTAPLGETDKVVNLSTTARLSTDTAVTIVIDPKSPNQEVVVGFVEGSTLVNVVRGVEGSAVPHVQGATVAMYSTASDHNGIIDWALVDHNPDGTHHSPFLVGEVKPWLLPTFPSGWLPLDGRTVAKADYPDLALAFGDTYSQSSSTLTLPDFRGRVLVGLDATQTEFNTLGKTGGEKTHQLVTSEMPSHTHIQPPHTHPFIQDIDNNKYLGIAGGFSPSDSSGATLSAGRASTWGAGPATATNNSTGGDTGHNNLQPFAVVNYIVRAVA